MEFRPFLSPGIFFYLFFLLPSKLLRYGGWVINISKCSPSFIPSKFIVLWCTMYMERNSLWIALLFSPCCVQLRGRWWKIQKDSKNPNHPITKATKCTGKNRKANKINKQYGHVLWILTKVYSTFYSFCSMVFPHFMLFLSIAILFPISTEI